MSEAAFACAEALARLDLREQRGKRRGMAELDASRIVPAGP